MHTDNKLANHGKQVSGESRSHGPGVNQQAQQQQGTAAGHLGPKGVSGNGVKTNQISSGGHGLKSVSQSGSSAGGMLKNKSKRERSGCTDSDMRNIRTLAEGDAKGEGIMRSKRRCVLERKQPYSGDEWCSGPDTEEDEEKPQTAAHQERALVGPVQGLSDLRSTGQISERGRAAGLKPIQTSQQLVYVFTTNLANSAAEAVLKGQSDSILLFHQQNVARTKLEQGHSVGKKTPNISEKVKTSSSPLVSTPKSQSGTPRPSSAGILGMAHPAGTPNSSGQSDNETSQTRPTAATHTNTNVTRSEGGGLPAGLVSAAGDGETVGGMVLPGSTVSPSESPDLQSAQVHRLCPENLSKEQLEHRERSLQTLRDIERLFLRSGAGAGPGDAESSINNPNNSSGITESSDNGKTIPGNCTSNNMLSSSPMGNIKKYEEPLQSIISQTQSLSGPAVMATQIDHPNLDHPHHQMSSPGVDMAHLLGPEGLTPEQIAWRKLQEEYYQEKRRQQEIQPSAHSQHFRMMSDMGMQGGPMMVRGPPPPYHSKPGEQQWGANNMGGAMRGNPHLLEMHQEGPRGPRFLGQISRGPPAGGFPGSPGAFPMEGLGHQRPNRPGMIWLDETPNNIGPGGTFSGSFPQPLQGDTEHLTREEMFRIMEKRQMQELSRFELERLSKRQQQSSLMSRLMNSPGSLDFPDLAMARGPPSSRGDLLDFSGPQEMLGSPGAGPEIRDLVDSPLGSNVPLNMNPSMNVQQQINLIQRLRGQSEGGPLSEIFGTGPVSQMRNLQSNRRGENRVMNHGPDGPFQFLNQSPFSGGQVESSYLQHDPEMFEEQGPNQIGGTMRLSHMPIPAGLRGAVGRSRHPSDPALNRLSSPSLSVPHRLKSPSLDQDPSPVLPSPSAGPGLKSPSHMSSVGHQPLLPPTSGAGTPSSTSMKSPQVIGSSNHGLHSPSVSPGQLKSPAVGIGSPGWTSPKPALPSPGSNGGKVVGNGGTSIDTGQSLPPRSSNSTPISQPGSTNTSIPFTSSSGAPSSQNPLSLIMSQMSKYAMPSSTPLYHDAIKTIATSDDEMMPDRPLLSGVSIGGNIGNSETSHEPQSPLGIVSQGQQQLSHDAPGPMLSSPNQMALSSMNSVMIGGGAPDGIGQCNVSPLSQNQISGFPRMPLQSHRPLHSPVGGMSQSFPQSNDSLLPHMISKGLHHQRPPLSADSFSSLPMGDGPDLSEVIRPTLTGIPEFDLSRIIPCDKPSSILQYFPKSDSHQNPSRGPPSQPSSQQLLKQLSNTAPSSNPHLANLQNMMAEQHLQPPSHSGVRQSMGGSRGVVSGAGIGPMCPPGHIMGRTAMSMQQQPHAMMPNNPLHPSSNPYPGMMSPQQHSHNPIAQHNIMMMQAKQRGMAIPGDPFGPQGALMSPQGAIMGPPQPGMMGPQSIRQRGMSLDSPYGTGGMANMPYSNQ